MTDHEEPSCAVSLGYLGEELPVASLLLAPENSLFNQALDPELHPLLQLAGWGFGGWSEHLLQPEEPFRYRRPMAAFYDDNAEGIIPSLQANTLLAHIRAADYNAGAVLADENCHPFSFRGTPWILAQNGNLSDWRLLQRELLPHCKDQFLSQMRGTTDTEFLFVLLASLLDGDDNDDEVQAGFERLLQLVLAAMNELDLVGLAKLKIAMAAPNRLIGVNYGVGHHGETGVTGDWRELREAGHGTEAYDTSMLLEPLYVLTGRNFTDYEESYDIDVTEPGGATCAILASEPLTEDTTDWLHLEFGEMVALHYDGAEMSMSVQQLDVG